MSEEHSVKRHSAARHAQPPTLIVAWCTVTLKFPSVEFVIVTGHRAHVRSEATLNSSNNQQKLYCVVPPANDACTRLPVSLHVSVFSLLS